MISGDTMLAGLLAEHPGLLEVLVGYHPHFAELRNPLLRRVMASRVTVSEAARLAGSSPEDLLRVLRRAAGEADSFVPCSPPSEHEAESGGEAAKPAALARVPESRLVRLDVREDIRRGQEPFVRIMTAVKALRPGQVLVLRAPFEPIPLYGVLASRGFAHWTDRRAGDDFEVWFQREVAAAVPAGSPAAEPGSADLAIDVRGLEPPQPMVRVLELLDALEPGQRLEVIHDRRPRFLYPQLDDRGFVHETDEPEPGMVRIVIRHR